MSDTNGDSDGFILKSSRYDLLKKASLVYLPALAALYFGLGQIWGFPKIEEVLGSVAVLETFLGAVLKYSSYNYDNSDAKYDGTIEIEEFSEDGGIGKRFSLEYNGDPHQLDAQKEAVFKVNPRPPVA